MALRVRPVTPEDAPALEGSFDPIGLSSGLATRGGEQGWVAVERTGILGLCVAGLDPDEPGEGRVLALSVREDRADALGALWSAAGAALAALGARRLVLWVPEAEAEATAAALGAKVGGGIRLGAMDRRELRLSAPLADEPFLRGLVAALDRGDPEAARWLDPEVSFTAPPCAGPAAVASAMGGRAAAPPGALEEQRRESRLSHLGADRWRVDVTERLRDGGHVASYRHALILRLPPGRGVTHVQALDLPGERARLAAFMRRIGAFSQSR